MKRRDLLRHTIVGAIGSALTPLLPERAAAAPSAREFPPGYDASRQLERPDWKPLFLDAHQDETLIVLSDLIIPAADTPGAKDALVNRFIDQLLAVETRETQRRYLDSLAFIDGECMARYKAAFIHLPPEIQIDFLKLIAYPHTHVNWGDNRSGFQGYAHFRYLKDWISRAYYSSEFGMMELGWSGESFHGPFEGCTHPEGTHR